MAGSPSFPFYPDDYIRDTRSLSIETKGIWADCLAFMHHAAIRGQLTDDLAGFARLFGCDKEQVEKAIDQLKAKDVCRVEVSTGGMITLINRRMEREQKIKADNAKRQAKFRENGGGDPERWTAIRAVILTRDGKICAYCGRKATTVDHVIPRQKNGAHEPYNLVACCKACNSLKGCRTPVEAGITFFKTFDFSVLSSESLMVAGIEVNNKETQSNTGVTAKFPAPSSSFTSSPSVNKTPPITRAREDGPEPETEAAPTPESPPEFESMSADSFVAEIETIAGARVNESLLITAILEPERPDFIKFVRGRAVGWGGLSPPQRSVKLGYSITDFQQAQKKQNGTNNRHHLSTESNGQRRDREARERHEFNQAARHLLRGERVSDGGSGDGDGSSGLLVSGEN